MKGLMDLEISKRNKRAINDDVVKCKSCSCTWMEQIEIKQFRESHNVILGQRVPAYGDFIFYLLKCVKCGELHEPHIQIGARDQFRLAYDDFLDHIENKNTKVETV